ncbi:MAG: carboxyl transferase domain-containing protein [Myxococcota bacterium]
MPPEVRARRLGRLAADERCAALCDPGTFVRSGARASRSPGTPAGDGVVVGVGLVDLRAVTVVAMDGRVARGSLGAVGAALAADAVRDAVRAGRPVALLVDCDGAREPEGVPAILATADWLCALADASGHVPLVAAVFGLAGGAAGYGAALCDVVAMVRERSFAFVAGPPVVASALGETSDLDALGGTRLHAGTGLAQVLADDDRQALDALRAVLAYLPAAAWTLPPRTAAAAPERDGFALPAPHATYDVADVRRALVDRNSWLPLAAGFGPSVETGFARIDGRPVALVASQPLALAGAIDAAAAQKLARVVRLAAAYNLPIVTLCDTPGFLPGRAEEARRILVHGAKVIAAYAEARRSVPLVAVILRRAVGAGSVLAYGADLVLALPGAEVLQMGAAAAQAARAPDGVAEAARDPASTTPRRPAWPIAPCRPSSCAPSSCARSAPASRHPGGDRGAQDEPGPTVSETLLDALERAARGARGIRFLVGKDLVRVSYAELARDAARIGAALRPATRSAGRCSWRCPTAATRWPASSAR